MKDQMLDSCFHAEVRGADTTGKLTRTTSNNLVLPKFGAYIRAYSRKTAEDHHSCNFTFAIGASIKNQEQ